MKPSVLDGSGYTYGYKDDVPVYDFAGAVDGGGYKSSMNDDRKAPMALIPRMLLLGTAKVLGYGAKKYAPNNWRRGMIWSEPYSALLRHLTAWWDGEDVDRESLLPHLWHAACCLAFLMEYAANEKYAFLDDRVQAGPG